MSTHIAQNQIQCPNCGANVRQEDTACPACGAPISHEDSASLRRERTLELIGAFNQDLVQAGSGAAESAFGLGCSLGTIFGLALLVLIFLLGFRNWILLGLVAIGVTLVAAGASALVSARAKTATMVTTYERQVRPEIEKYMQANRFTRQEFDMLVEESLDKNAPLRRYLLLISEGDRVTPEN